MWDSQFCCTRCLHMESDDQNDAAGGTKWLNSSDKGQKQKAPKIVGNSKACMVILCLVIPLLNRAQLVFIRQDYWSPQCATSQGHRLKAVLGTDLLPEIFKTGFVQLKQVFHFFFTSSVFGRRSLPSPHLTPSQPYLFFMRLIYLLIAPVFAQEFCSSIESRSSALIQRVLPNPLSNTSQKQRQKLR